MGWDRGRRTLVKDCRLWQGFEKPWDLRKIHGRIGGPTTFDESVPNYLHYLPISATILQGGGEAT